MNDLVNTQLVSRIGQFPKDWRITKIGEIASVTKLAGFEFTEHITYKDDGEIIALRALNLKKGKLDLSDVKRIDKSVSEGLMRSKLFKDDIVFSYVGTIGEVANIEEDDKYHLAPNVAKIVVNKKYDSKYVTYYLVSQNANKEIERLLTTSSQPALSMGNIREIQIPIPPLVEQQKIASILSTWDKAIELKEKLIEQKKEQQKGLMQKLLTGKVRLSNFNGEWRETKLGEIGKFLKGKGISKNETVEKGINCIRYGEIYTSHHFYIKEFYSFITKEVAHKSTKIIKNDLLFAGSGETAEEIGKAVAYLGNDEGYAGGDIIILRPTMDVDSLFLSYMVNTGTVAFERARLGQGHSVVHIYPSNLANLKILLPPIDEQKQIADLLKQFDKNIDLIEQEVNEIRMQKKGLMQLLLTGKIRMQV
ncbi:restriction endonuclease subunit S [Bacillus sp. Marseille-Q1617]|uniref:restriction endonuclease subunit S n=1 Tax=Bacillus sp. Marseille-Q1617 TaxID=2736887 RepID=UPI00158C7DA6|nr:restriction endonuclease subunit S [Bacillus sp. Marseille-Q1617]